MSSTLQPITLKTFQMTPDQVLEPTPMCIYFLEFATLWSYLIIESRYFGLINHGFVRFLKELDLYLAYKSLKLDSCFKNDHFSHFLLFWGIIYSFSSN